MRPIIRVIKKDLNEEATQNLYSIAKKKYHHNIEKEEEKEDINHQSKKNNKQTEKRDYKIAHGRRDLQQSNYNKRKEQNTLTYTRFRH